ncbi:glycosyltransferase family 2 protein [Arundinibacter roseus]|uniref:Glycosyltransferase family 2 protein n=1 Tax=Arundinibacter roseus TaxID=2070510 RepID=A0A4R4KC97_9BACT|nr:glycosyltransferase family 2 protein [Arundinibacter roseus]TDB65303.1 glycosyltransferase family 2 protein [Arundinibacter roseus]
MIDIIMPVYNSEMYIYESVSSMLNQTYENFRLLIFNDGSTDKTKEIIHKFNDKRIIYFESKKNIGYTNAINILLNFSNAKYIARMDADDISLPKRLELQFNFMESNPEYILCGTWFQTFGYYEKEVHYPENSEKIRVNLLSNSCIGHPTVMFKNGVLLYDSKYEPAEDYKAWAVLSKNKNNLMTNIPEILLKYRIHQQQVSEYRKNKQLQISNKIKKELLRNISKNFSHREINTFLFLTNTYYKNYNFNVNKIKNLIDKTILFNNSCELYNSQFLEEHLQNCLKVIVEKYGI